MSKEAMKLALEALEAGEYYIDDLEAIVYAADDLGTHEDRAKMQAAITALREALAEQPAQTATYTCGVCGVSMQMEQPAQQEPVAWIVEDQSGERLEWAGDAHSCHGVPTFPLYTSPPAQRKPLTRDQVKKLITATGYNTASPQERTDFINGIRHAEAAHGIKENT